MGREQDGIVVKGASENNLKSVDVFIPRNKVTVITGLSGSGKSSLAFDTIYAEGQRRYVEGLSTYARNFLVQLEKPDVETITGLSPSIAIHQGAISTNPRSTVGTVTEVYDYLRLLFAKVGVPHCPVHQIPVESQKPEQIIKSILQHKEGTKIYILSPVAREKKGEFTKEFQKWMGQGFVKAKIDSRLEELSENRKLAKTKAHNIDLVVDQIVIKKGIKNRLAESVNRALIVSGGRVIVDCLENGVGDEGGSYSIHSACPVCQFSFPELDPRMFSFNNPMGACSTCHGLGSLDFDEIENNESQNMSGNKWTFRGQSVDEQDDFEGIDELGVNICSDCDGSRLRLESRSILVGERNIHQLSSAPIDQLVSTLEMFEFQKKNNVIAKKILVQLFQRLRYLLRVGVGYLSLDRPARTLSGGEAQRIRLASQVGSALIGVLYVLDEPSIGLHPRDHHQLLEIIGELRDKGNTVLLVEHDEDTIRFADHVIDMGLRAGNLGGEVIAYGSPEAVAKNKQSLTGAYLSGKKFISIPSHRRPGMGQQIELQGATGNNLKNVDLKLPLGTLIGVTGVSGSGKSTLVVDTFCRIIAKQFYRSKRIPYAYRKITGLEHIDKVIQINQYPIGRTSRSTPGTYVGLLPLIRELFSQTSEARMRGYRPGRFSFNVPEGRCEECRGLGRIRLEMNFLSDVFVSCEQCGGRRYNRETLIIKYRDKNISDVLEMTVLEALDFFKNHKTIFRKLETLHKVGLDYMTLGQSSTTLSGGEAQRVKLSKELSKKSTGKTFYVLDEPTTGLHFEDVAKLVELLHSLVNQFNTVLVIEHNMDVIKNCDYVVDLGPEGGVGGGEVIAEGTPEEIKKVSQSYTGSFLKLDSKSL